MNSINYNYKKGLLALALCYLIWGFQPLYFALNAEIDTAFLLAVRILWAALFCLTIVWTQEKTQQLKEVFRCRKLLLRELPASLLLFADWAIYLYACRFGKVLECSMGYYIMPLVMVVFGAVIFREQLRKVHFIALALLVIGVMLSAKGFGGMPYVVISLALCFAVYSALKKTLEVDSIVSTTAEILMMVPFALVFILVFHRGELSALPFSSRLFMAGSGFVTALPMLFFAIGVSELPLSLTGVTQYISPTLGIVCGLILGEGFSKSKLLSFAFIWAGVILYSVYELICQKIEPGNKTGLQ